VMTREDQQKGAIKMDPKVQSAEDDAHADESTHLKEKPKTGITIFLRQAELNTIIFLVVMLCLEMGQSLTESLEFLFIVEELKSSPLLCGVSVAVAVVLEVPLLYMSEPLLRRIGILLLMLFGIFVFCVRITAFTFITSTNPWLILSVEPLAGVYVALIKMSSVSFMSQAAPKGQEAVAMGTMNVFRCMGQVFGTLIGSYILQNFGPTILYRSFGILVTLAGFVLIWIFQRKKRAAVLAAAATTVLNPDETARIRGASLVPVGLGAKEEAPRKVSIVELKSPKPMNGKTVGTEGEEGSDVIKSEIALLELHKT
jgi:MFS family permease